MPSLQLFCRVYQRSQVLLQFLCVELFFFFFFQLNFSFSSRYSLDYPFLFELALIELNIVVRVLQGICPFHLICCSYAHKVAHSLLLSIRICGTCTDVTFLIPGIANLYPLSFFLMSQSRGLLISLIFSKN